MYKNEITLIILILILVLISSFIKLIKEENLELIKINKNTNFNYIYERYTVNFKTNYLPSSYIFELFTKKNFYKIYKKTCEIQKYFGVNKTVYGIKKKNNKYMFEYYYYYSNYFDKHTIKNVFNFFNISTKFNFENYYLISFELQEHDLQLEELNIYETYVNCNCNKLKKYSDVFDICSNCLECKNFSYNVKSDEITEKNIYKFFYRNANDDKDIFEYSKTLFGNNINLELIYKPYLLTFNTSICITKKPDCIGLYFCSITYNNFIEFLKEKNFNDELVLKLVQNSDNLSYLMFDVGFDVVITNNNITFTKLSFYGIL
jgi:hypothetical protein